MATREQHDAAMRAAMHDVADGLVGQPDLHATLAAVTAAAVDLIDGIDFADILIITGDDFESLSPTVPVLAELDQLQKQFGEGPCLDAAAGESIVRCPDLAGDDRWPRFAKGAVGHGINSMLSYQLYTHDNGAGALNLFGRDTHRFDENSESIGAMLATQAAMAIIAGERQTQFQSALAGRDLIGQAKGIIMERFKVDAVSAFEMLRKLSQDGNEKLSRIAARVVDTTVD